MQVLTFLTFLPAKSILVLEPLTQVRAWVAALPFIVQFVAIMFLTRPRAILGSSRLSPGAVAVGNFIPCNHSGAQHGLDGWRAHAFHGDGKLLRSMTVIPMYVLGFSPAAMNTYVFVVYLYSTFVHANLSWRFPLVEKILVTPRFHHWHHGIETEAVDVNFSIRPFPLLDWLFGTYHLPQDKWPIELWIAGASGATWLSVTN